MGWFRRKPVIEPPVVEEPVGPQAGDRFDGPYAFSEGFYYPVVHDEDGTTELGLDRDTPLVFVSDAGDPHLEYAHPESPNHFHLYGMNPVELNPGA